MGRIEETLTHSYHYAFCEKRQNIRTSPKMLKMVGCSREPDLYRTPEVLYIMCFGVHAIGDEFFLGGPWV